MLDPRWEEDTLFLIFEEDFRFRETEDAGRRAKTELIALPGPVSPPPGAGGSGERDAKVLGQKNPVSVGDGPVSPPPWATREVSQ